MSHILQRIVREAGVPHLVEVLSEKIPASDLQSLMIEVHRRIAAKQHPSSLLSNYARNKFTNPSKLDPRKLVAWDHAAFAHLPKTFQAVEFSPISPLGSVSGVAPVSQDWILTTIRNTEVVAYPTNALALECAARRQRLFRTNSNDRTRIDLACSHRVLRTQHYSDPMALQHFRLFSLCTAGKDTGSFRFEEEALTSHLRFYLYLLSDYLGQSTPIRVSLDNLSKNAVLAKILSTVLEKCGEDFSQATLVHENSGREKSGYYQQFRFHIHVSQNGKWIELVDGGDTDWTRKLLNSKKERLVTSAIGSERVCQMIPEKELRRRTRLVGQPP